MSSNFPSAPDTIPNNVNNSTPEFDTHPSVHNQLADAVMAVEHSLLTGGSLSLSDHVAATDPHPVYLNTTEGDALIATHAAASDPHPVYLTQAEGDARYPLANAADPYPIYLTQAEGDARYAPVVGGGYLTQVQADTRYLQLAGGTLTGNLLFSADNTRDIGASGATRPRTLYLGTSLVTPGWTNGTNLLANTDNTVDIGASGANRPRTIYVGTSVVTPVLYGPSNVVEMRNGTTAQTLRIYNTYTDSGNYERFGFGWNGNNAFFMHEFAGTGVARTLYIGTTGASGINFRPGASDKWIMSNNGALYAAADNTSDIGQVAANRPRNMYVASGYYLGNTTATQGGALFGGSGIPAAGLGANGDVYFRTDGASGATIYQKRAGAWAATAA
jgi:hypothetical protein